MAVLGNTATGVWRSVTPALSWAWRPQSGKCGLCLAPAVSGKA